MTERSVSHATIVLERSYDASPARVFAAWSDVEARTRWGAPSDKQAIAYLESDFRVGGRDVSRCGPVGNLLYRVETRYHDIVPERRIVFTETVAQGATRLSVSLLCIEINPADGGTTLVLTDQIISLDGADMVLASRAGWAAALDNLADELQLARRAGSR